MEWASRIASIIVIDGNSTASPHARRQLVPGRAHDVRHQPPACSRCSIRCGVNSWNTSSNIVRGFGITPLFTEPCESASANAAVHLGIDLPLEVLVPIDVPSVVGDQVPTETIDRIAEWERLELVVGSVHRRIVRRGVRTAPERDPLQQGRAEVGTSTFGRPPRGCVGRQVIVAVDP